MHSKHLSFIGMAAALLTVGAVAAPSANAQFLVRVAYNAGTINDINQAEAAIANPGATLSAFTPYATVNFGPGDSVFPDGRSGTNDFALESLGRLTFNIAGNYVFRVTSDDGFRLRTGVAADGTGGVTYSEFVGQRGTGSTDGGVVAALVGGVIDTRLTYFERGGGEDVELLYSLNGSGFQTVGSTSAITVTPIAAAAVPEVGTFGMMLSALAGTLGVVAIRRRTAKR